MKKRLWLIHSWLGLLCGLTLIVIGLSGSLLVFHKEINRTFFADTVLATPAPGAARLPLDDLIATVRSQNPDFWIAGWLPSPQPDERDIAYLKRNGTDDWHKLRVDQYTGETADRPLAYRETLQGFFVDLHYTFFADHIGLAITAFFAIGLCALSVTGIWIYRSFWKNMFRLRWGRSTRILFSDIHKAVGIASTPLNLLLGFTGAYWNIAHLAHEWEEHADEAEHESAAGPLLPEKSLKDFAATAYAEWPSYELNYIYFPTTEDPNIYFYGRIPTGQPLASPYGSWMGLDSRTGDIAIAHDLREAGWWARVVDAFEPLHFGDFGGLLSKLIWCFAGLAPGILALSGSLIWFSRRRSRPRPHPKPKREATLAEVS